jgi:hypothetical protein
VTYGFTELYGKEIEDRETSGFGFELTLRVARPASEDQPPAWALHVLQNLGRYVFSSGNAFGVGHHMPLNSPICLGSSTAIWAIAFTRDPELKEFRSENGRAEFLQVVGITMDELELAKDWNTKSFLESLAKISPLLMTDLDCRSILADPALAAALRARADAEGSSMDAVYAQKSTFSPGPPLIWEIGALWVDGVLRGLKGRLLHQRSFDLIGQDNLIRLLPANKAGVRLQKNELTVQVTPGLAKEILSTLKPRRGEYRFPSIPDFVLRVVPTEIKSQKGEITEVVG